MVKKTQKIRRVLPANCLSVFDHFVGFALKGLINHNLKPIDHIKPKLRMTRPWSILHKLQEADK